MINSLRSYYWQYYLLHPWEWVADFYKDIKYFFQRGLRGYADCDWWMLNDYLITWLPSALRDLAKGLHGCPNEFFDLKAKEGEECLAWEETLEVMAQGFDAKGKLLDDEDSSEEERKRLELDWELGSGLFIRWFGHLWD